MTMPQARRPTAADAAKTTIAPEDASLSVASAADAPFATAPADDDPQALRARIRDLEAQLGADAPGGDASEGTGAYLVTAVGASYLSPHNPALVELGTQGRVVEIGDAEAGRLLMLGAVRAATDEDVATEQARALRIAAAEAEMQTGPARNPYGGMVAGSTSLEQHRDDQIALARKSGAIFDPTPPPSA